MRVNVVENAPHRSQGDYVLWPDRTEEHCSQFYPVWPLWRYPKKYSMAGTGVDEDLCQKSFNSGRTFSNGVFRYVELRKGVYASHKDYKDIKYQTF